MDGLEVGTGYLEGALVTLRRGVCVGDLTWPGVDVDGGVGNWFVDRVLVILQLVAPLPGVAAVLNVTLKRFILKVI